MGQIDFAKADNAVAMSGDRIEAVSSRRAEWLGRSTLGLDASRSLSASHAPTDRWGWLGILASVPMLVFCVSRISSGFDYQPAVGLARQLQYGATWLYAYPLPEYLPFAPVGALRDPWPQVLAPIITFAFLASALWLWGARQIIVMVAALLSPVAVGEVANSNLNTAVAVFGLGLAVWAKRTGHPPWVGVGMALSLWRPANCLPALAVLMLSVWRWRDLGQALAGAILFLAPIIVMAFLIQPGWIGTWLHNLSFQRGEAGLGPYFLNAAGPVAYVFAQVAAALPGIWLLHRRGVADAAAFSLALTVLLAPIPGAYAGALALPAVALAGNNPRYRALPAFAGVIGWMQVTLLLTIDFVPNSVVAYWYVLQTYPLLRAPARESEGPSSPSSTPHLIRSDT